MGGKEYRRCWKHGVGGGGGRAGDCFLPPLEYSKVVVPTPRMPKNVLKMFASETNLV